MIRLFCLLAFIASSAHAVTITLPFADFADQARVAKTGDIMSGPLTASSFTTTGSGMIGMALLGTTTNTYVGGGIGYLDYTANTTTTTPASNLEIIFSTLTVPANAFTRKGQKLRITCNMVRTANTATVTPFMRFNNAGTYTTIAGGNTDAISSARLFLTADLTWTSAGVWNNISRYEHGAVLSTNSSLLNTFDETKTITFNCSCNGAGTQIGECSFLDMRMEWGGM